MSIRTPAPVALVVGPTRWMWRHHQARKTVARQAVVAQAREAADMAKLRRALGLDPTGPKEAAPVERPRSWAAALTMRSGTLFRARRALYPIPAALALIILRMVVQTVPNGWTSQTAVAILLPIAVVAGAGMWWMRQTVRYGIAAVGATVLALLWMLWPSAARIPSPMPGSRWLILIAATAVACTIRHRRFRARAEEKLPATIRESPVQVWDRTLGADGPLAGTRLTGVHRVISQSGEDVGWRGEVKCVWGQHNASKVWEQRELIAAAYGRDIVDFSHERTSSALNAKITLTERDPFPKKLEAKLHLNDDGTFVIGSYADGQDCSMRLFAPGAGIFDFWFFGVKGSGKSTLTWNALGSIMSRGWVVLHLTDLKGGMSMPPEIKNIAYRFGKTAAEGLLQLRRLESIMDARMAECDRLGLTCLEPSAEWPIHLGMVEEAPQLWQIPEARTIAMRIKTLGRAVLIAEFDVSQMAELKQAWGGENTLRTQAQAGNVGCGYVPRDQAKLGFDHFNPDMKLIKKGSYHWFVTSPVDSREVLVKVAVVSAEDVAAVAVPGVPNAIDVAAIERIDRQAGAASREINGESQVKVAPAVLDDGPVRVTRAAVAQTLRHLSQTSRRPVSLSNVAGALAAPSMDYDTNKKHQDVVRKHLAVLVADPSTAATKKGFNEYEWRDDQ